MQITTQTRKLIYFIFAAAIMLVFVISPKAGIYDWDKEVFYARAIRDSSINFGTLPYVLWNREPFTFYPVVGQTALFISYPETFLFSPLMPLSLWLAPMAFLKAVALIHFAIGCLGVWMLGRQLQWNESQTRLFSALFLLSPIILQHVAIGYLPWVTLYYFPWLLIFLVHKRRTARIIGTGAVLAATLLNGGAHTAFWYGIFISFVYLWMIIRNCRRWYLALDAFLAACAAGLLGFARIAASFSAFGNFSQDFFAGYSMRAFIRMTLIPPMFFIRDIDDVESLIEGYIDGVPYWDGGIYWGAVLLVVLFALLAIAVNRNRDIAIHHEDIRLPMFLTGASFLILSTGSIYETLAGIAARITGFGGLTGIEKYPFRFAIMAYLAFSVFICSSFPVLGAEMEHWGSWLIKASDSAQKWISHSLASHRQTVVKVFKFLVITAVFLVLFNVILKPAVLPALHGLIKDAYEGNGWQLLERIMVNKDTLPVTAYLEKGNALVFMIVQRLLLAFCITACVFGVLAFPRPLHSAFRRFTEFLIAHRSVIIELTLALPLLFASLMWLRVAVSTPMESYATLSEEPILLKAITPADARLEVTSRSAERIEMICHASAEDTCEAVVDIPYTDSSWLQSLNLTSMRSEGDSLSLVMPAGEKIVLLVDRRKWDTAIWIMLGSWLAAAAGLVYWNLRRRRVALKPGSSGNYYQFIDKKQQIFDFLSHLCYF